MALEKDEILRKALLLIEEHGMMFHSEIFSLLPISEASYYNWKFNKDPAILEALSTNRVITKRGLRNKMFNSEHPTSWIALYKLIGDEDEVRRLNNEAAHPVLPDKMTLEIVGVSKKELKEFQNDMKAITDGEVIEVNEAGNIIHESK